MSNHIPALDDQHLRAALARLQRLNIPEGARRRMAFMLLEAANPDRHNLDRQPDGRREVMKTTAAAVGARMTGVMGRAVRALSEMDPAAFDELVSQANERTRTNE